MNARALVAALLATGARCEMGGDATPSATAPTGNLALAATATASSHYNVAPHETAFLPSLAIDGDDATAWSSLHEGCAAQLHVDLAQAATVATVCARSRDMVDDPGAAHTDDSVIESYELRLDGAAVATCVLPDWRQVYCCSVPTPTAATRVTLAAKTCRERADGAANTGFKTVQIFAAEEATGSVRDATLVGNRNVVAGDSGDVSVFGSDSASTASDEATLLGHDSRMLHSDESTTLGVQNSVVSSDRAIVIGHSNAADNADDSVLLGSHLSTSVPTQVVIGTYGAASHAKLVFAAGSSAAPLNLVEVHADGTIENAHIARLEARIAALEAALLSCGDASCSDLKASYKTSGCCPAKRRRR